MATKTAEKAVTPDVQAVNGQVQSQTLEQKVADVDAKLNEVVARLVSTDLEAQRLLGQKDILMNLQQGGTS